MEIYETIKHEYEKSLRNMQHDFENRKNEYEVSDSFPSKLPSGYQYLMDCRLQLLLYENIAVHSGETKQVTTTCVVTPNNGWVLSTKPNPELNLFFQEEYIKPSPIRFRVMVTVTNTTNEGIYIPTGICVGYLLLK